MVQLNIEDIKDQVFIVDGINIPYFEFEKFTTPSGFEYCRVYRYQISNTITTDVETVCSDTPNFVGLDSKTCVDVVCDTLQEEKCANNFS